MDEEKKDKPVKPEPIPGRVEKRIKNIEGTVNEIKSKLDTYEQVSGAKEERERQEAEAARAAAEEAIRQAGEKQKEKPDEKSVVSEEEGGGGSFWDF